MSTQERQYVLVVDGAVFLREGTPAIPDTLQAEVQSVLEQIRSQFPDVRILLEMEYMGASIEATPETIEHLRAHFGERVKIGENSIVEGGRVFPSDPAIPVL